MHEADLVSPPYFETGFRTARIRYLYVGNLLGGDGVAESLRRRARATALNALAVDPSAERPWRQTALFGTAITSGHSSIRAGREQPECDGHHVLMMAAGDSR